MSNIKISVSSKMEKKPEMCIILVFCDVIFVLFVVVLCHVYPFMIAPPVVFNFYLIPAVCPVYPFLIAPPVFFNAYLIPAVCHMSCVPNVTTLSGLSILDFSFDTL
jgi:hypothetical protein